MSKTLLIFATVILLISGCTGPKKIVLNNSFNAEQAKEMIAEGPNSLRGSALIRQNGGGVVTCAGKDVNLVPATAYAIERQTVLYQSSERGYNSAGYSGRRPNFADTPAAYSRLVRTTTCDAQGFFKFEKVANGTFFVTTEITWKVSDYSREGGALMQSVSLNSGESKEIVLAP